MCISSPKSEKWYPIYKLCYDSMDDTPSNSDNIDLHGQETYRLRSRPSCILQLKWTI